MKERQRAQIFGILDSISTEQTSVGNSAQTAARMIARKMNGRSTRSTTGRSTCSAQ